ncbi:glycoside hydrolase family 15 protein [Streptomyces sp. NPDC019937]|uniref:glycoside hydrolase family 15 protein n=1 Tax=Streptomyces sp. NPDC019937 TaxID=3154787 RepID=UPI0033C5E80A
MTVARSLRPRRADTPRYLPIAEHGLIGDLRTAALVGTNGTIDWYCPTRFDAPSVFASILDADRGGAFELAPDAPARTKQFYFPDTNILITRFFADDGVAEVQDFMPVEDDSREADRHRLIRRVLCVRGSLPFTARVAPRFDYGRQTHTVSDRQGHLTVFDSPDLSLALTSSVTVETDGVDAVSSFKLAEGEAAVFALDRIGGAVRPRSCPLAEAEHLFNATVRYWRRWLSQSRYRGRWREMVHRSALTLKLLTYAPTGAIVAAPTASLPEQIGGERNWDYRYVWIRDAAFCVYALLRLGFTDEAEAFVRFLSEDIRLRDGPGGPLQIMYGIDGRSELTEQNLSHLEGHLGSSPVRSGNGAVDQLQLDIYGALVDSLYLYDKWGKPLASDHWDTVCEMVDWVCEHWDQPDMSVWETRAGPQCFLYSRLMCWVAIERAIRIATHRGLPANMPRWSRTRDQIYRRIMRHGWSPRRHAFVQHEGDDVLDASVLMMPLAKFISPADPKWLSTLDALGEELVSDSLVYRYDPQASPDGLRGEEGTFSICSFWYVEALSRAGRLDEARLAFEKMLTYANHCGLYAEEIGRTGEQIGNFPQAFTHLALISAAFNLDRALG